MEANKEVAPSVTSVSISLSRKEQGALYMKSLRQAERIKELKEVNAELVKALEGVVRVADRKTDEFDAAREALIKAGAA